MKVNRGVTQFILYLWQSKSESLWLSKTNLQKFTLENIDREHKLNKTISLLFNISCIYVETTSKT